MRRLFIGIKCTGLYYLTTLQSKLKSDLNKSKINWVDPVNFHITLKFLGDVEEFYVNSIGLLLESVSKQYHILSLNPLGVGVFGPKSNPKVIWYGFYENPELSQLQQQLETGLNDLGFTPEDKKFTPHLTLARIKQIAHGESCSEILKKNDQVIKEAFQVRAFQLFESILRKQGPEYRIVQEFQLKTEG